MILITGFEPFGLIGRALNINPSEIMARKLYSEITKLAVDLIILPVNEKCIPILINKLEKYDYNLIFMMGGMSTWFRIETKTSTGKISRFAERIKKKLKDKSIEMIGDYYCGRTYDLALRYNPNTIFIHLPLFFNDYDKIKEIFDECLKWKRKKEKYQ